MEGDMHMWHVHVHVDMYVCGEMGGDMLGPHLVDVDGEDDGEGDRESYIDGGRLHEES